MITFDDHPFLDAAVFTTEFPSSMETLGQRPELLALLKPGATAPLTSDDTVRGAVRDLLRHGGYKPTGRGKPASEYLIRAVGEGALGSINAAVDCCNAVSLHSGLPISVVDLSLTTEPFRIGLAAEGTQYIFNAGGQTIDVAGLLCLFDGQGACANAVKDSQRTKTTPKTTRTMSVIWGTKSLERRTQRAFDWHAELLTAMGAKVQRITA